MLQLCFAFSAKPYSQKIDDFKPIEILFH